MTLSGSGSGPGATVPTQVDSGGGVVRWDRMVLSGFPPFEEPTGFEFPLHHALVVEADERRRRAFLEGLLCLLGGGGALGASEGGLTLPERGQGRLDFTLPNGERYSLQRTFSSGQCTVVPLEASAPKAETPAGLGEGSSAGSDALPSSLADARSPAFSWEQFFARHRLLAAGELLVLPPRLIEAPGPATLGTLLEARTLRLEGRAEELDAAVQEMEQLARSVFPSVARGGEGGKDDLVARMESARAQAREKLERLEAECASAEREMRHLEIEVESGQFQAAKHRLRELAEQHRAAKGKLDRANDTLRRVGFVQGEIAEWKRRLSEEPAHGVVEASMPQHLDSVVRLERERARLEGRVAQVAARIAALASAASEEAGSGTAGRGRSEKAPEPAAGADKAGGAEAKRADQPDFAALGEPAADACSALQEHRRRALRIWLHVQEDIKRLAELDRRIANQGAEGEAPSSFLEYLGNRLLGQEQRAAGAVPAAQGPGGGTADASPPSKLFFGAPELREGGEGAEQGDFHKAWVARERARLQEAEAELGGRATDLIPAIRTKLRLLETAAEQGQREAVLRVQLDQVTHSSDKLALALFAVGMVAGALGALYHSGLVSVWDLALSGFMAGAVLGMAGMAFTAYRTADLRSAIEGPRRQRKAVDQKLGKLAHEPADQLALYLERVERLVDRRRALTEMERKAAHVRAATRARQQRKEHGRDVGGGRAGAAAGPSEVEGPLLASMALFRERDQLASQLEKLCYNEWQAPPSEAPRVLACKASERWESLVRLAVVVEHRPPTMTVADLVQWLETLNEAWWERLLEQARDHDARVAVKGIASKPGAGAAPAPSHPRAQQRALLMAELTRQREGMERELETVRKELDVLQASLEPLVKAVKGDLAEAREVARKVLAMRQGLATREAALRRLLAMAQSPDVATLEAAATEAQAEMAGLEKEMALFQETVVSFAPGEERAAEAGQEVEHRLEAARELLEGLMTERARLRDGPVAFFEAARADVAALHVRKAEFARRVARLGPAWRRARAACKGQAAWRQEELAREIEACYALLSENEGERALMDRAGRLAVSSAGEAGRLHVPEGTARDRLLLGARLALANVVAHGLRVPLVLDVSGASLDDARRRLLRTAAERAEAERQVILVGHPRDLESSLR